jgi:KDO2-lipid IV(A) lauroyltransferase
MAATGLTLFDVEANLGTAAWAGRLLHRFDARHRQRARDSIARSFPEMSDAQIDDLTARSFEHFVQLVVEVVHTPRLMHGESWYRHVRYQNIAPVLELLNADRPVLLLTGHLGNWEVLGYVMALLDYPVHAIARPIDNPLINHWLLSIRQQHGMSIITKWNATERMVELLSAGQPLGFIADQNAGDKGLFVPFFGRLASTYKSIGLLAMSQNAPIACGCAQRVGRGYQYELITQDIIYPEEWMGQPDPLYYVTARYIRAIEMMIRRAPAQYLWMHRRWKSRPRYEREGKAMPAALQRNLEQLPWMDPGLMERLKAGV